MALRLAVTVWCLASLAAAHSVPQPAAAGPLQPSAADQLTQLLGPAVEAAVSRALASDRAARQQCASDADQRALGRLQERVDTLVRNVTALQTALAATHAAPPLPDRREEQPQQQASSGSQPEPGPACELQPTPLLRLTAGAPYQRPATLACARSCLQLRNQGGLRHDGVYWFTGMPVPVYCDFSHDGGGWTLLLTAVSQHGWDPFSVRERNKQSPSLTDNYSILEYGDVIRNLSSGGRFAYRIEAQAEQSRQRWGGVWFAPRHYSFVDETATQTDVSLVRRFDNWNYKDEGIERRMPWINTRDNHAMLPVLTTTAPDSKNWWGTLVTNENCASVGYCQPFANSPWIENALKNSGHILYWMKENIDNI